MTLQTPPSVQNAWLKKYYFARAGFSIVWVAAAFSLAHSATAVVAALLLSYPFWDAAANVVDARQSGGLRANLTQFFNAIVSVAVTAAIGVALTRSLHAVLAAFGVWALLSGLLQLATGVRRRRSSGGQWPMILSGAQSTFAGAMFVVKAGGPTVDVLTTVAPYAAFGAFYFLVAAVWLTRSSR